MPRKGLPSPWVFWIGFREKGASVVVTTHFDRLKAYGYLHPDVENVAVEFDQETLEPKYTLSYGLSGLSNAFLVAEKLGISERILERARHYREGGGQEISRVLETLEKLKSETEKERIELRQMKEEVASKRQRLKELAEQIKGKRQEIFGRAEEEARKVCPCHRRRAQGMDSQEKRGEGPITPAPVLCSTSGDSGHQGKVFACPERERRLLFLGCP